MKKSSIHSKTAKYIHPSTIPLEKYDNRVIRGLIQLLPCGIGSAIDVALMKTLEKIQKERTMAFFDELAKGDVIVDEELLESEDFLHAYFATTKYALNTRRREKIEMFARLLKSSLTEKDISNIDEYEDFLKVLDELSYRTANSSATRQHTPGTTPLRILDKYSSTARSEAQKDLKWTNQFWDKFEEDITNELKIPKDQIASFMDKIARTGCYEMFTGAYWDYTGGKGKLTSMYWRLKKFIEDSE